MSSKLSSANTCSGFSSIPMFKDYDRRVKLSVTHPSPRGKEKYDIHHYFLLTLTNDISYNRTTPTISEDGSNDDGVTVHCDSPAIAIGGGVAVSPTARKSWMTQDVLRTGSSKLCALSARYLPVLFVESALNCFFLLHDFTYFTIASLNISRYFLQRICRVYAWAFLEVKNELCIHILARSGRHCIICWEDWERMALRTIQYNISTVYVCFMARYEKYWSGRYCVHVVHRLSIFVDQDSGRLLCSTIETIAHTLLCEHHSCVKLWDINVSDDWWSTLSRSVTQGLCITSTGERLVNILLFAP